LIFIVFSFFPSRLTVAQSSASEQVSLPVGQLNFVGEQGVANLSRTLVIVASTNQTVNVTLTPTDLYDNSDGNVIPASLIDINSTSFSLPPSSEQTVEVVVNVSGVPIGTYQGAIALTSTNTTTTATINIPVTVNIEPLGSIPQQQVYLPISQLNFVGEQGGAEMNRTLVVVGLTNQTINVTIFATDLYDNTTGRSIPASLIDINSTSFNLSRSSETVNISIKPPGIDLTTFQPITYQGTIILTSTNATTTIVISIPVTVKIDPAWALSDQSVLFLLMMVFIAASLVFGEIETLKHRFTKFFVIICGLVAVAIYFVLVFTTALVDAGNLIYTALITPFIVYLTYYVKDLRDERKSLEDAARNVRNQNIGKDVETLTNLMGELTTHYVSFKSRIHKDGDLSNEVWKKERKEGLTSDFPLKRIEEYYSYITIYNWNYSEARKGKDVPNFEKFREKYAELETLLYVNLEYDLGALTILDLSPLQMEYYPRITDPLVKELINSNVLDKNYLNGLFERQSSPSSFRRDLSYKQLQKISKTIYEGKNTAKFLHHIDERFEEKYKELMTLAGSLHEPPDKPEKPKDESQIEGTYTLNAKDLKKALGNNDGNPPNTESQSLPKKNKA
jgi:hypothetical protein